MDQLHLAQHKSKTMAAWLCSATPDEWHQMARNWNWDQDIAVLRWIIDQPDCDQATALELFWLGQPCYYWRETVEQAVARLTDRARYESHYLVLVAIARRWKRGGFTRSELAFDPQRESYARVEHINQSATHPHLAITADMIAPLHGRTLPYGDLDEGVPESLRDQVMQEWNENCW